MRIKQGARQLPPEIERGEEYDPFPVDMYYLGNVYMEHLLEVRTLPPSNALGAYHLRQSHTRIWSLSALWSSP